MPKVFTVSRNTLLQLYINNKLGSYEIARKLGCSQSLIMKRLREYGIPTRSVQAAKALVVPKFPRTNFSNDPVEKAYLIGFRLGDLYVSKTHPNSPTIRISTNSTIRAQLELVKNLFSTYGHVHISKMDSRGAKNIRCFVNCSFSFLLDKKDSVEKWILRRKETLFAFVAGYADAEGTFCISSGDGIFGIKSQDKNIVHTIWKYLNYHGILCKRPFLGRKAGTVDKRGIKNNRDVWQLTIYRKDSLLSLIKEIKPLLKHSQKIKEMSLVKQNIEERNRKFGNKKDRRWYKTYHIPYERALKMASN